MSVQDAADYFHKRDYENAAEILKNYLYNSGPTVEHNNAINDYYTKPNPRSQSKLLLKQLNSLHSSYPEGVANRSVLLFNEAELQLNRHQYSKSVEIFKSLIDSDDEHIPINIYFRSCLRLFSIYLHHEMIEDAKLIHCKLSSMTQEDIASLDSSEDPAVSSLKHEYWCHIMCCHLKLIESTCKVSNTGGESTKSILLTPVQEAYKELTKAIDLIKKQKQQQQQQQASQANTAQSQWTIDYKIRILFIKAHQDFISGNINTAKSQLFQTHSYYQNKLQNVNCKPPEECIAFLNNMSCIYGINDECGSAMNLIQRALSLHAQFMDKSPLYAADHMISYLCYNAGLYLQNLKQYTRAIDSFLCCLPVLQSKPRLWLRMAQCILAIWEPYGGFEHNVGNQPQINSLVADIVQANSTKRGDLYLLPIGRKPVIYNNIQQHERQEALLNAPNDVSNMTHILQWHERRDSEYSFPYDVYQQKEQENEMKRRKRWKKRKEKQTEFAAKIEAVTAELDVEESKTNEIGSGKNDNNEHKAKKRSKGKTQHSKLSRAEQEEQDRSSKQKREQRLYDKEKIHNEQQQRDDDEEYQLQVRELNDMKLAVEWLKNAISLFKKMETNLYRFDYVGHKSAHLHLSYCYLKLKAWTFAYWHAEKSITIHKREQTAIAKKAFSSTTAAPVAHTSTHTEFLARMYAAEALLHQNKFNQAIQNLNPGNFPHITALQQQKEAQTPRSSKSAKSHRSKHESKESKSTAADSKEANESVEREVYKEKYYERVAESKEGEESEHYLAILVNLATTYICKDALDKAHKYIHKALSINDEYYPALRMLIYLHMRMGNNDEAIKIIKYRRPIPVKQFILQSDHYMN